MTKSPFNAIPEKERAEIIQQTAVQTGLPAYAVEKDWWVTEILRVVFEMEAGKHLVFKGGTSLSKAWKAIERFSEDIDLAIDRDFLGFEGELSKSERTKLRKAAKLYIYENFSPELEAGLANLGY